MIAAICTVMALTFAAFAWFAPQYARNLSAGRRARRSRVSRPEPAFPFPVWEDPRRVN